METTPSKALRSSRLQEEGHSDSGAGSRLRVRDPNRGDQSKGTCWGGEPDHRGESEDGEVRPRPSCSG